MLRAEITERLLGVEIECVVPIIGRGDNMDVQHLLVEILRNAGIVGEARAYCHHPLSEGCMVAVEHDSSLRDESRYQGLRWSKIEIKTKPVTFRYLSEWLPIVLDVVNYCGARVNASCGLHVHHHLPEVVDRPQVVRNLQHLWWRFHPLMYAVVAPSRRANTYCIAPRPEDARLYDNCTTYRKLCDKLSRANRYCGLNLTNLSNRERMTVEWRIHQGTTDWVKIKNWLMATQRWTEHAVTRNCHYKPDPMPNTRAGINNLLVVSGLKGNSRVYRPEKELRDVGRFLLRRWKRFNSSQEQESKAAA